MDHFQVQVKITASSSVFRRFNDRFDAAISSWGFDSSCTHREIASVIEQFGSIAGRLRYGDNERRDPRVGFG